jgi:hypothetical protein
MATKTKRNRGFSSRSMRSYEEIKRIWGDVEVVDAKNDLRVFIQQEDVNSATQKDPGCCVFAQACKRQFSATKVLFWKSVAYVELPGKDGRPRVERFFLSSGMRDLIDNFDKGKPIASIAGFELKKPSLSRTFEGARRCFKKADTKKREALLSGIKLVSRKGEQGIGAYSKPARVIDLEVRNGSGRVHFKKKTVRATDGR